jgi:hypothetical protein
MATDISLDDIAAAIADELQLDDAELLSVSQITVSVTYQVDRHKTDWMDEWYDEFASRELVPF